MIDGKEILIGNDIDCIRVLKSMYNGNNIQLIIKGKEFRIQADEMLKVLKRHNFKSRKAQKYNYLILNK